MAESYGPRAPHRDRNILSGEEAAQPTPPTSRSSSHAPTGHVRPSQVCHCEQIRVHVLKQEAEVLRSRRGCLKNPFAPDAPRVLAPEAIATKRIAGTDSDESLLLLNPEFGHVSVTLTPRHGSAQHGPCHHEACVNQERQVRIRAWGRDQMDTSKADEQVPKHLKAGLLVNGLAKTTVQETPLLFRHEEIASLTKRPSDGGPHLDWA